MSRAVGQTICRTAGSLLLAGLCACSFVAGLLADPRVVSIERTIAAIDRRASRIEARALASGRNLDEFKTPWPRNAWEALSDRFARSPRPPLPRRAGHDWRLQPERITDGAVGRVYTLDADQDGRPERVEITDSDGGRLEVRIDTDDDGWLDASYQYIDRQMVSYRSDLDRDGTFERELHVWRNRPYELLADRDGDGQTDARWAYVRGRIAYAEHDLDGDGRFERRIEYVRGRRHLETVDRDGDGLPEGFLEYGPEERPQRTGLDSDRDGLADVWEPLPVRPAAVRCGRAECGAYLRALERQIMARWNTSSGRSFFGSLSLSLDQAGTPYGVRVEPSEGQNGIRGAQALIFAIQMAAPFGTPPAELTHTRISIESAGTFLL